MGLKRWAENTTFHGISDLYTADRFFERLIWLIVIIGCLTMSALQIIGLTKDFLSEPHYHSRIFMRNDGYALFPNITLCHFNRASKQKVAEMGIPPEVLSGMFAVTPYSFDFPTIEAEFGQTEFGALTKKVFQHQSAVWEEYFANDSIPAKNKNAKSVLKRVGFECEDLALSCSWGLIPFDCCANAQEVVNQYGRCWSLQVPGDKVGEGEVPVQMFSGSFNGLRITLSVALEKQYREASRMLFNNYLDEGLLILPSFDPFVPIASNPIALGPGNHYYISLRNQLSFHREPQFVMWTPDCETGQGLKINKAEWTLAYVETQDPVSGRYSEFSCMLDCMQQMFRAHCGCVYVAETLDPDEITCNITDWDQCVLHVYSFNLEYMEVCTKDCRASCKSQYKVESSVTFAGYPAEIYKDAVENLLQKSGMNVSAEELIVATIYYANIATTVMVKQEKLGVFTFIGNVGLWCGMSLITIFQLIYYVSKAIFHHG